MKRPKDMTDTERRALPEGPHIRIREPITLDDIAKGMCGRWKERVEHRPVMATYHEPDDIMAWRDSQTGESWTFGQWADGSWYRQYFGGF